MRATIGATWMAILTGLLAAAACCAPLAVAIVPPQDYQPTISQVKTAGAALQVTVDELTPEQLVDPGVFNATRYPLAVYVGGERYAYTVKTPGDGAEALLRYVHQGGTLLVAGMCWPFYRPVDYFGNQWTPSKGEVPQFRKDADEHLVSQMQALGQNSVGNFNRYLGINISGEGTEQFEAPDEPMTLRLVSDRVRPAGLPESFPFPSSGDLRFRPASERVGLEGVEFEAVIKAVGKSMQDYGAAMAVIRHSGPPEGVVVYVWGTLMTTSQAPAITADVLRLAGRRSTMPDERRTVSSMREQLDGLVRRNRELSRNLSASAENMPARGYLIRDSQYQARILDNLADMILVRNFGPARDAMERAEEAISRLETRLAAVREP